MPHDKQELTFEVGNETCAATWFPAEGPGPHPAVVMGHGLGGTRELGLEPFARRFQAAGISALVFDYRHYGGSTGEPRELLSISKQLQDFRAAIAFVHTLPDVNPERIAIWGSSFGGGHVMTLAAEDLGIAGAVSQVPFSNGLASTLKLRPLTALRLVGAGLVDLAKGLFGAAPRYVKLLGRPGEVALMSAPDSEPGYMKLVPQDVLQAGRWRNRVAARIALAIPFHSPGRALAKARVPMWVAVADSDTIAPAQPTIEAGNKSDRVEVVRFPAGHFDYYAGDGGEQLMSAELAFLRRVLS